MAAVPGITVAFQVTLGDGDGVSPPPPSVDWNPRTWGVDTGFRWYDGVGHGAAVSYSRRSEEEAPAINPGLSGAWVWTCSASRWMFLRGAEAA